MFTAYMVLINDSEQVTLDCRDKEYGIDIMLAYWYPSIGVSICLCALWVGVSVFVCMQHGGFLDRKSTRLNSSHMSESRMPSSA